MTASLYVRTPMNSKPTRLATSVNTPSVCSSQRLLENMAWRRESQAALLPWEEPSTGSEVTEGIGRAVFEVGSSWFGGFGGEMSETLCESAFLGLGGEESDGEVALLPRECGREYSKELDEELVLSDGARSLGGGDSSSDEATGSMMVGFA